MTPLVVGGSGFSADVNARASVILSVERKISHRRGRTELVIHERMKDLSHRRGTPELVILSDSEGSLVPRARSALSTGPGTPATFRACHQRSFATLRMTAFLLASTMFGLFCAYKWRPLRFQHALFDLNRKNLFSFTPGNLFLPHPSKEGEDKQQTLPSYTNKTPRVAGFCFLWPQARD